MIEMWFGAVTNTAKVGLGPAATFQPEHLLTALPTLPAKLSVEYSITVPLTWVVRQQERPIIRVIVEC